MQNQALINYERIATWTNISTRTKEGKERRGWRKKLCEYFGIEESTLSQSIKRKRISADILNQIDYVLEKKGIKTTKKERSWFAELKLKGRDKKIGLKIFPKEDGVPYETEQKAPSIDYRDFENIDQARLAHSLIHIRESEYGAPSLSIAGIARHINQLTGEDIRRQEASRMFNMGQVPIIWRRAIHDYLSKKADHKFADHAFFGSTKRQDSAQVAPLEVLLNEDDLIDDLKNLLRTMPLEYKEAMIDLINLYRASSREFTIACDEIKQRLERVKNF